MRIRATTIALISLAAAAIACSVAFVLGKVRSPEYSQTKHAVANLFPRSGIDITGGVGVVLPDGLRPTEVRCSDDDAAVSVTDRTVTIRLGYSTCTVSIHCERVDGSVALLEFHVRKENNWSQIELDGTGSDPLGPEFEVTTNDPVGSSVEEISLTELPAPRGES